MGKLSDLKCTVVEPVLPVTLIPYVCSEIEDLVYFMGISKKCDFLIQFVKIKENKANIREK